MRQNRNPQGSFSLTSTIKKYLWRLFILLGILFLFQKIKWLPSFSDIFGSKSVKIDDTPILIKEINNLSQLVAITSFDELVMDSVKRLKSISIFLPEPTFKIVLIGRGKVMAGVDLKKLTGDDVFTSNDSVSITLPKPEILYSILNPSDFETFDETGNWSADEVTQIKIRMRDKMIARALEQNLLKKAGERCKTILADFFKNTGFKKVLINIRI